MPTVTVARHPSNDVNEINRMHTPTHESIDRGGVASFHPVLDYSIGSYANLSASEKSIAPHPSTGTRFLHSTEVEYIRDQ